MMAATSSMVNEANTFTNVAQNVYGVAASNIFGVNLPTTVNLQYDANGNLTNDGLRSFAYDDENELIQVLMTNQWLSQFSYDGKMRRRIRHKGVTPQMQFNGTRPGIYQQGFGR
jgi:YD repeat-containing protein